MFTCRFAKCRKDFFKKMLTFIQHNVNNKILTKLKYCHGNQSNSVWRHMEQLLTLQTGKSDENEWLKKRRKWNERNLWKQVKPKPWYYFFSTHADFRILVTKKGFLSGGEAGEVELARTIRSTASGGLGLGGWKEKIIQISIYHLFWICHQY